MTQLKVWWGLKYVHSFNGFHKLLVKGNRITVDEEPSGNPSTQGIQVSITGTGANGNHAPHSKMQWEESSVTSTIFLTKMHYSCLHLIVRKHQVKPTLRGICTCWDCNLQKCQGHKNQGDNEELRQTEDAQKDMTADAHVILDWTLLLRKWCYGDSWQTLHGATYQR